MTKSNTFFFNFHHEFGDCSSETVKCYFPVLKSSEILKSSCKGIFLYNQLFFHQRVNTKILVTILLVRDKGSMVTAVLHQQVKYFSRYVQLKLTYNFGSLKKKKNPKLSNSSVLIRENDFLAEGLTSLTSLY